MLTSRWSLLLVLLCSTSLLSACPTRGGNSGDDDDDGFPDDDDDSGGGDDDDASGDDDDATTPAPPETECLDGLDNDNDGQTDCDDDDCDAVWECTWPSALAHTGDLDYEASFIAELAGAEDCVTRFTSTMTEVTDTSLQCPTCSRTYTGPMLYTLDTCPVGDDPRPTQITYGVTFITALQIEVLGNDGTGIWSSIGFANATIEAEPWSLSRVDEVNVEGTDAGDLTTTLTFQGANGAPE